MKRYNEKVLSDATGLPVQRASILVTLAGTSEVAAIFGANDPNSDPADNPILTDDVGRFGFYAPNGVYDLKMTYGNRSIFVPAVEIFDLPTINERLGNLDASVAEAAAQAEAADASAGEAAGFAQSAKAQRDRVEAIANTGVGRALETWAALAAIVGTAGDGAIVLEADGGSHHDPVKDPTGTGAQVPNAGVYSYVGGNPSGWTRIANLALIDVEMAVEQAQEARDETQQLLANTADILPRKTGVEANGGKILRVLWGIRELGSWLPGVGMMFNRLMLKAAETRLDDSPLVPLLRDRIARPTGPEVATLQRLVVGSRLLYDVTIARGLYPRRMTIPASARMDDDLTLTLRDRLGGSSGGGVSGPDICCAGDSLTLGAGDENGRSYPEYLADLTGRTVRNLGIGGETSATIAGRMGADPFVVTVAGGQIPTSGPVNVSLSTADGAAVQPLIQGGNSGINPCKLAGVVGVLGPAAPNSPGVQYTFTRSAPGAAVPVPYPLPLITDAFESRLGDIMIMFWGQNDATNDATAIIARQRHLIEELRRANKRWLVLGLTTGGASYRAPMEAAFLAAFGRRFVNLRAYLSSPAALAREGITPTQDDLDAMAIGNVPPSIRVDPTHGNSHFYKLIAYLVNQRLTELEWL
ncbi:hypothetical protein M9979_12095 [Sphingomonas sp. RP10(2022)]|uniref:Uncharacterized protein n=1 Tax=Sphingomonas liriopis TaxID=2949094 RepID=A0A9X2HU96_9SPHN|nr:hypothetical protein [Sphingomonas liriopis]MCP3735614.1 hypothetical protein [Sphingomonas liriopis]